MLPRGVGAFGLVALTCACSLIYDKPHPGMSLDDGSSGDISDAGSDGTLPGCPTTCALISKSVVLEATVDLTVRSSDPAGSFDDQYLYWDTATAFSLLSFGQVFGTDEGLIDPCACVETAGITFRVGEEISASSYLHESRVPWGTSTSWNTFGPGPGLQAQDVGDPLGTVGPSAIDSSEAVLVTAALQRWRERPEDNHGFVIQSPTAAGAVFSSESTAPPRLSVTYYLPQ